MAIKFRRIEDRAESVIQHREREAVKRERVRLLPKLLILALVAAGAVVVYGYLRPPRIVAPFFVHVDATQVAAPVEGALVWLLPRESTRVAAGEVLARIHMWPQSAGSAGARLADLRLRAAEADSRAAVERAAGGALQADLDDRARSLQAEIARLEGEVERARLALAEAERHLEVRARDARSAEELRRVDAITLHDRTAAQEAVQLARAACDEARGYVGSLEGELAAARAGLEQFQTTRRLSLAAAESRVQAALSTHEALAREAAAGGEALAAEGEEYVVRAPFAGQVLSVEATPQSRVEQGTPLLELYDDARVVARAFVPVRYQGGLRRGAAVRLYVQGLDEPIAGQVDRIHARVTPLPRSLADRLDHDEASVIAVDVRCAPPGAGLLIPGQIGRAVIEK